MAGSFAQKWSPWRRAIEMIGEGRIRVEPLITDVFPLPRWQEAFGKLNRKQGLTLLLNPQQGTSQPDPN